ncbi:hypothetical protein, partial [Bradyrhizobium sp.]|uniref:hypothetical protein n=1 Tax=Bradyrhizobium sp. TaxID=376 RepID=UPI003C31E44E
DQNGADTAAKLLSEKLNRRDDLMCRFAATFRTAGVIFPACRIGCIVAKHQPVLPRSRRGAGGNVFRIGRFLARKQRASDPLPTAEFGYLSLIESGANRRCGRIATMIWCAGNLAALP